jgi:integrase
MASLIKDPQGRSPYWIAVISTIKNGRPKRVWRSTKVRHTPLKGDKRLDGKPVTKRDLKLEALDVARAYEQDIRIQDQGEVTARNLRRLLGEIEGEPMACISVRQALEDWIDSLKGSIALSTTARYMGIKNAFLEWLGPRAEANLASLGPKDFLEYRNQLLAGGRTPETADLIVRTILGAPVRQQVKLGTLSKNPLANVPPLKMSRFEKGVFTLEEISRLLKVAEKDWQGAIMAGFYLGSRLKDTCNLGWGNVDLEKKSITYQAGKTGQLITVPIHPEFEAHLLSLPVSDDPQTFLFPSLAGHSGGGTSGLSTAFKQIMEKAGIAAGIAREKLGPRGKTISSRSWHSLRHTFNSQLAAGGVNQELRQKLIGHSSAEMNSVYTHHELAALHEAITRLPRLPGK